MINGGGGDASSLQFEDAADNSEYFLQSVLNNNLNEIINIIIMGVYLSPVSQISWISPLCSWKCLEISLNSQIF